MFGSTLSHPGSDSSRFRRRQSVCRLLRAANEAGRVEHPISLADSTRSETSWERLAGRVPSGLFDTLSSSSTYRFDSSCGSDLKWHAEMSSTTNDATSDGKTVSRNDGIRYGVGVEPSRRCVEPARGGEQKRAQAVSTVPEWLRAKPHRSGRRTNEF